MANIPWLPQEEADLLAELPAGEPLRRAYWQAFLKCHASNVRRTFESWRLKARALNAERDEQIQSIHADIAPTDAKDIWQAQQAIVLRENERLRTANTRLQASNALMVEAIEESIVRLPAFVPPKIHVIKSGKARRPQTVMLDISDVHGGEVVRPEDVGGLGEYNFEMCKERMDTLTNAVLSISDIYQTAGIVLPKLVINFLGDIVTNEDIYLGQARDIDRILVDQIVQLASELSRRVIYPLCQYFPEVQANAVWGNHGRTGKKGQYHQRTNADYLVYHFIRQTMAHVEHFDMRISLSSFMGYVLPEDPQRPHLLAHGDKVRRYMAVPWYGMARWEARMVGLTQVPWAFTHLGHHHQGAAIDGPHGERLMNGSWVGGSDFSINELQAGSQPKQTFCGLHPEHGKTFHYNICLSPDRPKLTLGEDGLYTPIWNEGVETKLR